VGVAVSKELIHDVGATGIVAVEVGVTVNVTGTGVTVAKVGEGCIVGV